MSKASISPTKKAWKRLVKNKSAVFGMIIIVLMIFIAIFAYVIAPDNTENANEHIYQLETHPPGHRSTLLYVTRNKLVDHSIWNYFAGKESQVEPIPILQHQIIGDSLKFLEYRGSEYDAEFASLHLVDIAFPYQSFKKEGDLFSVELMDGSNEQIQKNELVDLVESKFIRKQTFLLGTDKFGRDILSRLIIGVRISLSVGLISVLISLVIGVLMGSLAGFFRGKMDQAIMWVINVFWSIPTLLLAMGLYISVGSLIGSSFVLIFIAVGLTMWVSMARIVRGQILGIRELEYVAAAKSMGFSNFRTIFKHILPNIAGPLTVIAAANFANAILIEAGLSFIGLGVQPPTPSWGSMLNEYRDFIDTDKAYLAFFPGIAIMLLVLAFNLVGNGLRDALDIKTKL